jgi:hypothetical protein
MPRRRPKTAADQAIYRAPALRPLDVPNDLEPFFAAVELRGRVEKLQAADSNGLQGILAEHARGKLIERRSAETLDAWKTSVRPLLAAKRNYLPELATSEANRTTAGYRRHREEGMDALIRRQIHTRELEAGLTAILERDADGWHRRELVEIVDKSNAGSTAAEIAAQLGIGTRTVERRLAEIRNAASLAHVQTAAS